MRDARIVVNLESIRVSSAGSITGVVFWDFTSTQFPETDWSDFVVVVLSWWTGALAKLASSEEDEVQLDFMDGPFSITLRRQDELMVKLECKDRGAEEITLSDSFRLEQLRSELVQAASIVLQEVQKRGIRNKDVKVLARNLGVLERS